MKLRLGRALWLLLAALAALALLAAACGDDGEEAAPQTAAETPSPAPATPSPAPVELFPVTVTDSNGKQVSLEAAPQRIVALGASFVEILYAIGAGDAIVAVDQNSDYPPEAAEKTKISGFQPSVEAIASFEPDLVLIFFDPGGLQEALEQLGITVLFLASPQSLAAVFDQIQLLGRASGRPDEVAELIAEMRAPIDDIIEELIDVEQGPSVFHELDSTYFTVGPGSFVGDLYALLKARNIAEASGEAYSQMSAEAIIEADPEVIILADEDAGESPDTVAARPGWDSIAAVRNGRVHTVDPDIVSRPGPRLAEALATLARLLYPERFP